jgi:hypothetical protein
MLPNSPLITISFVLLSAAEGAAIGGVAGSLISLIARVRPLRVRIDALLGACGFLFGLIGCAFLPWHQNTIDYTLSSGVRVTSTANFYQHSQCVAIIFAILLPVLCELNRFRISRRDRSGSTQINSQQ